MGERTMNTWLGLLKWSLNYHDGTKPVGDSSGVAKPMSDADRAWLMAALKAHTVDEVERMKLIRSILSLPDTAPAMRKALTDSGLLTELHTGPGGVGGAAPDAKAAATADDSALIALGVAEKLKALEELDERVETIDNALDFCKIGGLQPLLQTLRNLRYPELVWRAAQVFSTVLQNNPKCQAQALDLKLLDALLPLLDLFHTAAAASGSGAAAAGAPAAAAAASADVKAATPAEAEWQSAAAALTKEQRERVVTKALLATSSLVRDNPSGLAQFLATGSAVQRLLHVAGASGAASGLRRKAVSLLRHILSVAVETQQNAAQSAAIAQAGPAAAASGSGVKVTVGQRGGPQKLGAVTITGGPANGAAAAAPAAAVAAAAAAPAAPAAEPAKTDVQSATAAVNALKQSIVAAGGVGVLAGLIDFAADIDLRSSAVELLNELLSGAPDAPGAAAALSALKAAPTHAAATKAIAARVEHYKAVPTAHVSVTDPSHADAVDACRAAYSELQLLWRLVQFGAFPDLVKALGAEYRRFAVVVAKADAEERKQQAAAAKARGVGSLYSTSQAAPTRQTHTNTDTPVVDTPLLK